MAAAKKIEQASSAEVLAELDGRCDALRRKDAALLAEQLKLEADGATPVPVPNVISITARADPAAYLDHGEIVPQLAKSDSDRLYGILREREAIRAALDLAAQRGFRLRVANHAQLANDTLAAWRANIQATVKAVHVLRELARERKRLRDEFTARTGLALADHANDGGAGHRADRIVAPAGMADTAQAFLEAAARSGAA